MVIREATPADAQALSVLSTELGYPAPPELMRERIFRLAPEHAVFVADEEEVLGWIEVGLVFHLQTGMRAEVGGLVVLSKRRSKGIGKKLLQRAEEWAAKKGVAEVMVRSNKKRSRAHQFYLREGYEVIKTSEVFLKKL